MTKYVEVAPGRSLAEAMPGDLVRSNNTSNTPVSKVICITEGSALLQMVDNGGLQKTLLGTQFSFDRASPGMRVVKEHVPVETFKFINVYLNDTAMHSTRGSADRNALPGRQVVLRVRFIDGKFDSAAPDQLPETDGAAAGCNAEQARTPAPWPRNAAIVVRNLNAQRAHGDVPQSAVHTHLRAENASCNN